MERWFLVQSKARDEFRAAQQLESQQLDVFLPLLAVERLRRGRRVAVSEPLFPGYLFVRFDPQFISLTSIQSTRGVARLVRFGNLPMPVPDRLIDELKARGEAIAQLQPDGEQALPRSGDKVRIVSGPFQALDAVFLESSGERRALVLVELIGKTMQLEVDHASIERL